MIWKGIWGMLYMIMFIRCSNTFFPFPINSKMASQNSSIPFEFKFINSSLLGSLNRLNLIMTRWRGGCDPLKTQREHSHKINLISNEWTWKGLCVVHHDIIILRCVCTLKWHKNYLRHLLIDIIIISLISHLIFSRAAFQISFLC